MSDEMEEIISEFIVEAEESLDKIEPLFVELEKKGHDKDMLNDIFRSMHTIKGAAGFLGFQGIVDVAHSSESIMKKLRDCEISLTRHLMDIILKSVDMLRALLEHLKAKDGIEEDVSPLVAELRNALDVAMTGEGKAPEPCSVDSHAGGGEANASIPPDQHSGALHDNVPEADRTVDKAPDVVTEHMHEVPGAETEKADTESKNGDHVQKLREKSAQNLRVDVERIDKVMDLAGEVVLVRNRLLNISNYFDLKYGSDPQTETLMETVSFLDRVTSDMQLAVMKIRMQPIKKVLSKFPRFIRDMAASVGKEVDLEIIGEGTEVDKSVIENIADPMTHILRNSIDHGIESPQERTEKGKPAHGKIIINIYQKGNQIVIEISDDGKGMDVGKLKDKAVQKGLITQEDAAKMSDESATDIIFLPGFSTKEIATELSGRGVGMDVVKTNVSQLNGYVEVTTAKDSGTTFRLCIPLTLAIIQALMVEVSGSKFAVPLSPIEETIKVSGDDIDNVSGQQVIVIRDRVCPLFDLGKILETGYGETRSPEQMYLIVVSLGERKFCLAVDRLLGQEDVVIKNLDGLDTADSYVLGATITGDGKVVFILDVAGISRNMMGVAKN